ncbi:hypothetical protein [Jingyaoa shaoxingensis]|uniref:DUF3311 domain-containing protein n=1 Tax=Jingyaoa shaoxingensis TaxID=2763671 RepID=A0ABR7NF71_9FIRM|nr:hypothetical protein [Jingyaoa shaoxingensis]MBC8574467.1 hypothetical protein [Jingyaoa shaoxingensis]
MRKIFIASMAVMWITALRLPAETGWTGAVLSAVPFAWLMYSAYMSTSVLWDGDEDEKHIAE